MTNPLIELTKHQQYIWYDNLNRELTSSGELQRMVDEGQSHRRHLQPLHLREGDRGQRRLRRPHPPARRAGARPPRDLRRPHHHRHPPLLRRLRPVYGRTAAADGYASLEVSPEIAYDTAATTRDAKRLFAALERPNAMIKIPGTAPGLRLIEECLAAGCNINITLLFGVENYEQVALRYLRALERRVSRPASLSTASPLSPASSSAAWTPLIDSSSRRRSPPPARTPNASSCAAPRQGRRRQREDRLREVPRDLRRPALGSPGREGARVQRPLWASTSTKNPAYRDVIYVEELIGPDTDQHDAAEHARRLPRSRRRRDTIAEATSTPPFAHVKRARRRRNRPSRGHRRAADAGRRSCSPTPSSKANETLERETGEPG